MIKKLIVGGTLLVLGYCSWRWYVHYFDHISPDIQLVGVQDGAYYRGVVPCCLNCSDRCQVRSLRAWLDDRQIINEKAVNSSTFQRQLSLVTRALTDGPHSIKIEADDGSKNHNRMVKNINFNVDNAPLQAAFALPASESVIAQGRTLHLPVQLSKQVKKICVKAGAKEFQACPNCEHATMYECFIPIDCEAVPGEYPLSVAIEDFVGNTGTLHGKFAIQTYPFHRQVLHHINPNQFEEERKLGKNEQECTQALMQASQNSPFIKRWHGPFLQPINVTRTMCEFGTKRVSQERGCYTHTGVDVVGGVQHTAVWAPNDGVLVIKDRFGVNGNFLVIDHGCGVLSMLGHLDHFSDIKVGDFVKRGQLLGVTGKTGYATGDHLHWEMRINNIPVDPVQWTKIDF